MSKALILFAPGLEECEGLITVDLLRRAGCIVDIASITNELAIKGSHNIQIICDTLLKDVDTTCYDALILPGGGIGVENLSNSDFVKVIVNEFYDRKKIIGAVCAAPTILSSLGLLKDKTATVHHSRYSELQCAELKKYTVITDGNVVTGSGLGTTIPFALALISVLESPEVSNKIKEAIEY